MGGLWSVFPLGDVGGWVVVSFPFSFSLFSLSHSIPFGVFGWWSLSEFFSFSR